jgi:hypothetical protein
MEALHDIGANDKLIIKTGTEEDFFASGRRIAKAADQGKTIAKNRIISFEDPVDVMRLITETGILVHQGLEAGAGLDGPKGR